MTPLLALAAFAVGAVVVVVSTEYFLEGLVGISTALRLAPFVASVITSRLESDGRHAGPATLSAKRFQPESTPPRD